MKTKTNKMVPFLHQIDEVCTNLLQTHMNPYDTTMITGIQNFGARMSKISENQRRQIGRCSKLYLQNGKFEEHNWWY